MEEYMDGNGVTESENIERNLALSVCQLIRLAADSPPLDTSVAPQDLTLFKGRIFECLSCDFSTGKLHNLKQHNKCHQTRKEYQCTLCNFSSNYNNIVSKHQKSDHQSHHLDAENENDNGIEKDSDNMDEELYLQQSPDSPPHQEIEVCAITERLDLEPTFKPISSSAGKTRLSFKKKNSLFSTKKKTLKKGIFGLSDKSRITRSKSKLNENDSVPLCCEMSAQSSNFEEDTNLRFDQHTIEGEENSVRSEELGSSSSSLPDLEQDFLDYGEIGSCDSPPELEAIVDQNTSEDVIFVEIVVNKEREVTKKPDIKNETFASSSGFSGGPTKGLPLPLDWKQDSLERFKNQVEVGSGSAQGSLLVDIGKYQIPKTNPGNDLVTAMEDSTMDVVILNLHQSEAILTEEGNVEKSLHSPPNASMELEKVDPSRDTQPLEMEEEEEEQREVRLPTNAVSENDLNKRKWERNSRLLEAAAELIERVTDLTNLATQISYEALPYRDQIDDLEGKLQGLIGEFNADLESDRISMKNLLAFLRQKQHLRCEIENKILETHAIVDTAKETIRVAEEALSHLSAKGKALRFSIQKMCDQRSYLGDALRIELKKELAALDTATDSTSEAFAAATAHRQRTIELIKKETKQLETELLPLNQQENSITQDEERAGENLIAASEQLVAGKLMIQALELELSNLLKQDDSNQNKDLAFIGKKTNTYGLLNICLRQIQVLK